ncbi:hypothetical protein PMAYCL1PPCAC_10677, partial [Pristionchus mayeri]
ALVMSLTAGATTVSLGGYAASVPSTSSLPFSYSPAAGAFSGSGSGYEEGGSGGNARFDRAPPVPPPTSLSYARYAYYEVPSTSGGGKEHPLLASAWREPDKFRQCLARAHDVRTENEEANGTHNAYGTFQMPDGSLYAGITRKGALFCRSGFWLEVKPGAREGASREADGTAKRDAINLIRGTRNAQSNFTILEFIAVTFGLISMRAVESNSFVCMDSRGRLYAAAPSDYSSECIFVEEMLENYFNLYSSCSYGTMKKPWYMAIRRTGAPRNGLKTRKRRKAAHFLVVHHDLSPELRLFKPKSPSKEAEEAEAAARAGGKLDLQSLLANTMKHRPVEDPNAAAAAGAAEEVGEHDADADPNERILTIKLEARLIKQRIKKKRKKIPTREERLASDQQRREERKELLARKRIEEQEKLRRLHIEYGKQVQKQHEEHRERLAKEARERAEAARKSLPYSFSNTVSNRTQLTTQSRFNGTMLQVNVLRPKAPHQSQPSPQYTHRDTRRIETTRSPYNVQHRHSPIR